MEDILFCHYEDKKCYTKADAEGVIPMCNRKNHRQRQKNVPRRMYYCEQCGYYHLTHIIAEKHVRFEERFKQLKKNKEEEKNIKKLLRNY